MTEPLSFERVEENILEQVRAAFEAGRRSSTDTDGQRETSFIAAAIFGIVRSYTTAATLSDGRPDASTVQDVAHALDMAEVPAVDEKGRPYTVAERVSRLGSDHEEALGHIVSLEADCETVSQDFERDLWKANRRIIERLGFDWKTVGSEGVMADDVEDFINDAITRLERRARPRSKPLSRAVTQESAPAHHAV